MRIDPNQPGPVQKTDSPGLPQMPRGPLAYARPAPTFLRAMQLAQNMQPGGVWMAAAKTTSAGAAITPPMGGAGLAPESSVPPWQVTVKSGQTLSGIVKEQMAQKGVQISTADAVRLAQTVAKANQLANPDLIHPGQKLELDSLHFSLNQGSVVRQATQAAAQWVERPRTGPTSPTTVALTQTQLQTRGNNGAYPVLDKTLDRAVEKGFIPPQERQAVYQKILQMSAQHRFSPDDFARLTLMESDGMNPKATNARCHGIIQFCDGPDRGAATVGFANNPRAIMNHGVLRQLDMVDKYFEETGLRNYGPVSLDDLYLTVLTPAARNETRPNVALNIPGPQASYLHVNRDTRAPITRNSILAGLHYNANERLRSGEMLAQNRAPVGARNNPYASVSTPQPAQLAQSEKAMVTAEVSTPAATEIQASAPLQIAERTDSTSLLP